MDSVEDIAKRLNLASDRLNIRIAEEEARLRALNLGVECWVVLESKVNTRLGYTNGDDGWGLYLTQTHDEVEHRWRLARAPRGLRLYALKHIPEFTDALMKTAHALTIRIERFLDTGVDNA